MYIRPHVAHRGEITARQRQVLGLIADNVLVYVKEAGKKLFGIGPETASGARYATRRASPGTNALSCVLLPVREAMSRGSGSYGSARRGSK
jgi:hypothetical protein